MDVRMLRNAADHAWAVTEYERYFDREPAPGTQDADRFELLGLVIRDYEERTWPIADADPVDLLRFAIDDMGRSQAELSQLLGSRSRASEVLNRKRPLTLDMVHRISAAWHIPLEALARPYPLDRSPPAGLSGGAQPRRRRSQRA